MYILADFGNKENKKKRKAAENRISIDRVYSDPYALEESPSDLAKRKASELRTIRERRQLDIVDPLQYRSKQKGKNKITAPYTDNTGSYYLPEWQEKGTSQNLGREQNRGGNYIGSDTKLSNNPKRQARVDEILKNQNKPKVKTVLPTTKVEVKTAPQPKVTTKAPSIKINAPSIKVIDTPTVKGKGGLGLLGAGALGLAGVGGALYLVNRKKKENQNG